jgi:hypothetical protein
MNLSAPSLTLFMGWVFFLLFRVTCSAHMLDANQPSFLLGVERKTALWPVPGVSDQVSFNGIHVHVVKFFDEFALTPDIEIVKARLPEFGKQVVGLPN